ncbi:hypothetical protein DM02DRAFT_578760 [Periconia macrospinosa]|uniref:LYC1 C-terminal domain-containing protein n=1 Tax=Periconia macrospinosa TaxID=97972 RepID=A0A2V1ED90_9PLEO|nr:hypothetical protein DM02DRAFT_578760 [Periconia macrospinosa]
MAFLNNLPDGASAGLALVHPTADEKLHQFKLNGNEWRGALSHEAYLRREHTLSNQALTRDNGITYWILIDTAATQNALDPKSPSRLPLASCETYRKKALVWRDGKVQDTICHGIGSVFCAPQLRGRRYGQRMMQEVGQVLKTHQVGRDRECLFSVLYSDIGKNFYAKYGGWEPFTSSHVSIPAGDSKHVNTGATPIARPLYAGDLAELCAIDETLIRKGFEARPRGSNVAVALIPDVETMQWHHAREEFVGAELHGKEPKVKGAIVGEVIGKRVWMYWTRVWYNGNPQETKGNTLYVLRLVVEGRVQAGWHSSNDKQEYDSDQEQEAIMSLLAMAQREAEEWKMEQVEVWNPSPVTVEAARRLHPTAEREDREEESIASLKWYAEHEGPVASSIDWVCNEKYGWC